MEARLQAMELRDRLAGALQREGTSAGRLIRKLEQEQRETQRADMHQRYGDLILACPQAKVVGEVIVVPDLYDPAGGEARIPGDPGLSPKENAERHYARARKLRRGEAKILERMKGAEKRSASIQDWSQRLARADSLEELSALATELTRARILEPARHASTPSRGEKVSEDDSGVRKYRTEDGYLILVGKTSRDNDRLTFQVASPHDFWLHAADRSGAHVVVRNPSRLKELPPRVLMAAAQLAAHFSRAKGKGKVEVHYTLRKHVRKGKGFAPGKVTIRNHRTLEVEPGVPGGEA
jgi:predicted ribosome quality control (RQC) complex YloA/Tae2 family protein